MAQPQTRTGMAALTRLAFEGRDMTGISAELAVQSINGPGKAAALMDLSVIEQLKGNLQAGLDHQLRAFSQCRVYRTRRAVPGKWTVLVLAAPIHMGGNTPVEFLLQHSDFEIITHYVIPGMPEDAPLPEHDIAFVAAPGDSGLTRPFIDEIASRTRTWPVPVLNAPRSIVRLERDCLPELVSHMRGLRFPTTVRCSREELMKLCDGQATPQDLSAGLFYPLVVRPVGAHAGRGLEKIERPQDIAGYLEQLLDEAYFVSEYVDYASASDGAFRKYRIVFVDGRAYPCHMAISDQWKIWYMNAEMQKNAAKRAEEAAFMDRFDQDFARRHLRSFTVLSHAIGLDYFGIDCAEDRDGNLVLFEADNALIVHDMDCDTVFPYKKRHMRRLFDAFDGMLQRYRVAFADQQRRA